VSAAPRRSQPSPKFLIELSTPLSPVLIVFFEQPQRLADNFAGRIVATRFKPGGGELFKLEKGFPVHHFSKHFQKPLTRNQSMTCREYLMLIRSPSEHRIP
jgi:hypothetical protein